MEYAMIATRVLVALVATFSVCAHAAEGPPPGATSCTGCHPASAKAQSPVPPLARYNAASMTAAFKAYRSGERSATVMDRIAKGFSDEEVQAIADWYASQP
jgi:cytochrome c553